MPFYSDRTWVGAGAKFGGGAILQLDTFQGVAFRLDDYKSSRHLINYTGMRLGLSLGGGISLGLFFAFNVGTLWEVDNTLISDWGFNVTLPGFKVKSKSLLSALDLSQFVTEGAFSGIQFARSLNQSKVLTFAELAQFIYTSYEPLISTNPTLLLIDTPINYGAEVSLYTGIGDFNVDRSLD